MNIEIKRFKSIKDVYSFIEIKAFQIEQNRNLAELFIDFRNNTTDELEKQNAQWEMEFFIFEIYGNKIYSPSYSTGMNIGKVEKYPNLDEFQHNVFEYLKRRSETTKNALLLARYNHLLWKSPKGIKNEKYALLAIENYIESIMQFYNLFEKDKNKNNIVRIGQLFEILVGVCDDVKSGIEELKTVTNFLLFNARHISFYIKHGIIDDMLKYPKIFKKADFRNTLSIFQKEIKRERKRVDDFFLVN